jgi:hypothetical protein
VLFGEVRNLLRTLPGFLTLLIFFFVVVADTLWRILRVRPYRE